MSAPKLKRVRTRPQQPGLVADPDTGTYVLPVSVSRPELLVGNSDRRFRMLLADLLSFASRMDMVREHFGKRLGINGPQYTVLTAIAHFQGKHGISAGALAQVLHLSLIHI